LDPEVMARPGPDAVVELLLRAEPDVLKPLRHLPTIRADLVQVLLDPELRRLCSYALLADPGGPIRWGLHSALEDIVLARREGRAELRPARFSSRREVADFCRSIKPLPRPTWSPARFKTPFYSPAGELTLVGEPRVHLRPIDTPADMLKHGLRHRLCIPHHDGYPEEAGMNEGALLEASWTDQAGRRRRATVWLIWESEGWVPSELAGQSNHPVPGWLRERLLIWSRDLEPVEVIEQPLEPLRVPEPEPQQLLPLEWSPSPLDGPAFEWAASVKCLGMEYGDWCDTEGWLFQWEWL